MAKSQRKTKRNPKSKPKSKSNLHAYGFDTVETTSPEAKKKKRLRENIFYTVTLLLFVMMFVGVPVVSYWGNSLEEPETYISGASNDGGTSETTTLEDDTESINLDDSESMGATEEGSASIRSGESVIKKKVETDSTGALE